MLQWFIELSFGQQLALLWALGVVVTVGFFVYDLVVNPLPPQSVDYSEDE